MNIFKRVFAAFGGEPAPAAPLPADALVIDVRSPAEYAAGHLKDAIALPLVRLAHDIAAIAPDRDTPLVLYCRSGARSGSAQRQLQQMGYRHVVNGGGLGDLAARTGRAIVR